MKKVLSIAGIVLVVAVVLFYCFWVLPNNKKLNEVRAMVINEIDIASIADGVYVGSFSYSKTNITVEVHVVRQQISTISVLEGPETKYGLLGRQVIEKVLDKQTLQVDVVSGATTTSKATLKAIENALSGIE